MSTPTRTTSSSSSLSDSQTCAALVHLLQNMPEEMCGRWMDSKEIHNQFKKGGFPLIPISLVSRALRSQKIQHLIGHNKFNNVRRYMFGNDSNAPKCYHEQISMDWSTKECWLSPNFYSQQSIREGPLAASISTLMEAGYSNVAVTTTADNMGQYTTPNRQVLQPVVVSNEKPCEQEAKITTSRTTTTDDQEKERTTSSLSKENCIPIANEFTGVEIEAAKQIASPFIKEPTEEQISFSTTGTENKEATITTLAKENKISFRIVSDSHDDEFIKLIDSHARICVGQYNLDLRCIKDAKKGYDTKRTYKCFKCNIEITRQTGFDEDIAQSRHHKGPSHSQLNIHIPSCILQAGINVVKAFDFFRYAGISCPTLRNCYHQRSQLLEAAEKISLDQLKQNRQKHVAETRRQKNYVGDLVFVDGFGEKRSIARGKVSMDGAGPTRAYKHRITGTKHILVVYSGIIHVPLYVTIDQISCLQCRQKLSEHMNSTGQKAYEVKWGEVDWNHEGKCHRNSDYGPAVAEEHAAERAGRFLLNLPDDEAIYGHTVVSDNDTRGPHNFINIQKLIIGDAAENDATRDPDEGHTLKGVSNGMYKLTDDKSYSGKNLLNPSRIRAITHDVGRHIHKYHNDAIANVVSKERKKKARATCLAGLNAIIPHHCGDHSLCNEAFCMFIQIENEVAKTMDRSKINFNTVVMEKYTSNSRFGSTLSLDKKGIQKTTTVITSRINSKNIDRIAQLASSNYCELFFGNLTYYSEGKRLNWEANFESYALYTAGARSNTKFADAIENEMGFQAVGSVTGRAARISSKEKRRTKSRESRRLEPARIQRMVTKQAKNIRLAKDGASSKRHRSDKVATPKNDMKEELKKKRKKPVCSRCGEASHTVATCTRPKSESNIRSRTKDDGVIDRDTLGKLLNL